jgi:hypothetical protein
MHISNIVRKASRASGLIWRAFSTRKTPLHLSLFKAYVRPILEYGSTVWNPSSAGLTQDIERVQRRFTKRLRGLRALAYDDRLSRLNLVSLETRRRHADLLMMFKVLNGHIEITSRSIGLALSQAFTRGSGVNLSIQRARNNATAQCFRFRVGKRWNSLPLYLKAAKSVGTFKRHIAAPSTQL